MPMNSSDVIVSVVVAICSVILAIIPFTPRCRNASLWLRLSTFIPALLGIIWSILNFYLMLHDNGGRTSLPWPLFWALDHIESNISGLVVGILLCVTLSPEALSLGRERQNV